ncbi:hypothetical protein [Propioniciclava sinopodophylli]|uniref:hypothetical protein n=1 Tax=Propioniciclava sinopodophylli TaxID=1837344 RepID=UPI0013F1761A|nr:hypothetical protein [Propioniciclava sinopodophylli]
MARSLEQNMGPEALTRATGRDHEQWPQLLTGASGVPGTLTCEKPPSAEAAVLARAELSDTLTEARRG